MFKREKFYLSYLEFEKKLYTWLVSERHKIIVLVLVILFMWMLTFIPYLNLLINMSFIIVIATMLSLILFKVNSNRIILLAILLFLPSLIAVLLREYNMAEVIGNYIYGFLLLGSILSILKPKNNS